MFLEKIPSGKLAELWNITICNGKTHYEYLLMAIFTWRSAKLTEGISTVVDSKTIKYT